METQCQSLHELSEKALTDLIQHLTNEIESTENRCDSIRNTPRMSPSRHPLSASNSGAPEHCFDSLGYLEKILQDKVHENSRLRDSNSRLQAEAKVQDQTITELSNQLLLEEVVPKQAADIQKLKERVGECNVHIQRLKKELEICKKRCQREQANMKRELNLHDLRETRARWLQSCKSKLAESRTEKVAH